MAKIIVEHEVFGNVLLDTETGMYEYVEKVNNKIFTYNNRSLPYFDHGIEFLESNVNMGIFPAVCTEYKKMKKRYYYVLLDRLNNSFVFYNVELINYRWISNKIDDLKPGNCYFLLVEKESEAINDFMLKSTLLIRKGMAQQTIPNHEH